MRKDIILYVVIGALTIMLAFQFFETRALRKDLATSMSSLESKVTTFDSKLGRAQTSNIESKALFDRMVREVSRDIKDDISSSLSNVEAILSAKVVNKSAGGGKVVRPPAAANLKPNTPETWEFKDWRLSAKLAGDDFSYELSQTFDFSVVQTDKTYYLRVWELAGDGSRMEPPLVTHSFSAVRLIESDWSFDFFDPQFELSAAAFFASFSIPQIHPEFAASLMSYGKDNRRLLRAIRVGVTIGDTIGLTLSPISYNLGYHLPVFDNIWISPTYGYDSSHYVGLSIGASL